MTGPSGAAHGTSHCAVGLCLGVVISEAVGPAASNRVILQTGTRPHVGGWLMGMTGEEGISPASSGAALGPARAEERRGGTAAGGGLITGSGHVAEVQLASPCHGTAGGHTS